MRRLINFTVLAGFVLGVSAISHGQPEIVSHDGQLPYGLGAYPRPIAIGTGPGDMVKGIWIEERLDWRYDLHFAQRDEYGDWESRFVIDLPYPRPTLFLGSDGRAFVNSGDGRLFIEDGEGFISREIFGDPVMDSTGCFHRILLGSGYLIYSFSADTLQSISYQDTVYYDAISAAVEPSADRGLVCAVLVQADSLLKFTGQAGVPLQFDTYDSFSVDAEQSGASLASMGVDKSGQLFIPYTGEGHGEYWAIAYVWSERFGSRFLNYLDDPALTGFQMETSFAGERDTVFVIQSTRVFSNSSTWICFSTDGGDIWNHSLAGPEGGNCTAPRLSTDFLHTITDEGESHHVYHQAIPVEAILENYTNVEGASSGLPVDFSLSNYPNPFNSSTTISFTILEFSQVDLSVYDVGGRLVNTLLRSRIDAGYHSLVWDGRNSSGQPVSSGVYFYRISTGDHTATKRMLLLK